jgi:hypothetical protein
MWLARQAAEWQPFGFEYRHFSEVSERTTYGMEKGLPAKLMIINIRIIIYFL